MKHRRIGILGGLSPESTITYYEHITRTYTSRFGNYGYPEILIYSVSFQEYMDWQYTGNWEAAAQAMSEALNRLHVAGADFGLIATNTMHMVFDRVQLVTELPLLSIVDATAEAIGVSGIGTVGLLGTAFTMREKFFRDGLAGRGIECLVPAEEDQAGLNQIIYGELCRGELREESRRVFQSAIARLEAAGARGIVLGCTEIPLLIRPEDCSLPLFNTTTIHAEKALDFAMGS